MFILHKPLVQLLLSKSSQTDWCNLQASLKSEGAMSLGARPCNQLDSQNSDLRPFPIETTVLALNNCLSSSLQGASEPTQGLSGSLQLNQSQRNLSARLKRSRSGTPNPPSFFGRCTTVHRTRQCPPWTPSSPFQRKPLLILSIRLITHFFVWKLRINKSTLMIELSSAASISLICSGSVPSKLATSWRFCQLVTEFLLCATDGNEVVIPGSYTGSFWLGIGILP